MVRRVAGDTDTRGVCDPDGSQPAKEPAQPTVAAQRTGHRDGGDRVAVHTVGDVAAVHTTARIVVSGNCVSCGDLSFRCAGRQVLVLSPARAALTEPIETACNLGCFRPWPLTPRFRTASRRLR